ncbi:hypothetical protein [Vibrio superstes]|uniref:hypothetical protein n=1 Tax=Vibrio superstes TaxID=198815 RepID=UPI000E5C1FB7|nr:hypothetical protein [Vibrio superstes]
MLRKFVLLLGCLCVPTGYSATLPFGFEIGDSLEDANVGRLDNVQKRIYCPYEKKFPTKAIVRLSDNFMGFSSLDFIKLSDSKNLETFLEFPAHFYSYQVNSVKNRYKKTSEYKEHVYIAKKLVSDPMFKEALGKLPDTLDSEQHVFKVEGGYVCADYADNKLWRLSINAEGMNARFHEISGAITSKYNQKANIAYSVSDCYKFYRRYNSTSEDNQCTILNARLTRNDNVTIEYQLSANHYKKGSFEKLPEAKELGREKGGYVHYLDESFYNELLVKNNESWDVFESNYHLAFKRLYENMLDEYKGKDNYLEQF